MIDFTVQLCRTTASVIAFVAVIMLSATAPLEADDATNSGSQQGLFTTTFSVDITPPLGQPVGLGSSPSCK
jgi:hypothetical protein